MKPDANPSRPAPLPVAHSLLETVTARPFGIEERVEVERAPDRIVVRCRAGDKPAGLLLDPGARRIPDEARLALTWQAGGDAGFSGALASRHGAGQQTLQPIHPGETVSAVLPLDEAARRAPVFVLNCPMGAASLTLTGLHLAPLPAGTASPERSAWAWKPALWQDEPERLLAEARALGLDRLFVAVDVADGRIAAEASFAAFIARARAYGLAVAVVEGDPRMVLAESRREALDRLAALVAYQRQAPGESRLAGLQYDIEPYLLPAYRTDPEVVRRGWADTIVALHGAAGGLALDFVLPFWLSGDADAAATVLPALARAADRITIMAYRTDGPAIQAAAEPLLAWGSRQGVPVHVALEAGPLDDEATQVYAPASNGALHLAPQQNGRIIALLLDAPQSDRGGPAQAYALSHETATPARQVSFLGDENRLLAESAAASRVFQAWPAFAGMAYHGLIE